MTRRFRIYRFFGNPSVRRDEEVLELAPLEEASRGERERKRERKREREVRFGGKYIRLWRVITVVARETTRIVAWTRCIMPPTPF